MRRRRWKARGRVLGAFGAPGTSGCSRCPADSEFIFTALPGESVASPFEYSEAAPHGGVRTSSSAQRSSALESQDSKPPPARHGPESDASVGTARHQRRLRRRDQLRNRGRGRPLAAVSTAPVPAEEVSGDSLHRCLRRGRAPGGRTILRRAGMRRGGGPLGVPVAAPRDRDPDARTEAPINDAIANWYSNGEVVSMSLSHQDSCQEGYFGCVLGHFREAIL